MPRTKPEVFATVTVMQIDEKSVAEDLRRAAKCLEARDMRGTTFALQRALEDVVSYMNQRKMIVYWKQRTDL